MRLLVFEAITGGGLIEQRVVPSGSLLSEGLGMLTAICADFASHQHSPVQGLLRKLSGADGPHQISFLWDNRLSTPSEVSCDDLLPELFVRSINAISLAANHFSTTTPRSLSIKQHDPASWARKNSTEVCCNDIAWEVRPSQNNTVQDAIGSSKQDSINRINGDCINAIRVDETISIEDCLRNQASRFDKILIVAPEPTLSAYVEMLGPFRDRLLNLPAALLRSAEDKRNYTTLPYRGFSIENGRCAFDFAALANADAAWWRTHSLVVKPRCSCGATDVWRIDLREPIVSLQQLQPAIDFLISEKRLGEGTDHRFMLMPWCEGTSVSVSFLATENELFQFPACNQTIKFAWTDRFRDLSFAKIEYAGSSWANESVQQILEDRMPLILNKLIQPEFRNQLRGWFSIDFVVRDQCSAQENTIEVLDFNGRWTSSYGLIRKLGFLKTDI